MKTYPANPLGCLERAHDEAAAGKIGKPALFEDLPVHLGIEDARPIVRPLPDLPWKRKEWDALGNS